MNLISFFDNHHWATMPRLIHLVIICRPNMPIMQLKNTFSVKRHFPWWIFYLLLAAIIVLLYLAGSFDAPRIISLNKLEKQLIEKNAVEKIIVVDHSKAEVYLKPQLAGDPEYKDLFKHAIGKKLYTGPHYWLNIAAVDSFEQKINAAQQATTGSEKISIEERSYRNNWRNSMTWIMPVTLLLAFSLLVFTKRKVIEKDKK
jgi:AFG3 family protein